MYKKFVKFGRVVFEICEQTDRHTDTLTTTLRTLAASEVNTHRPINNDDSPAFFGVGESVPDNAIQTTETQLHNSMHAAACIRNNKTKHCRLSALGFTTSTSYNRVGSTQAC